MRGVRLLGSLTISGERRTWLTSVTVLLVLYAAFYVSAL